VVSRAGTDAVVAALDRILRATETDQRELDRLDAVVGDGDHGVTMVLGWRAVAGELATEPPDSPGDALRRAAQSFAAVGGTAGPLWGTALLRAGRALEDVAFVDVAAAARAAAAAAEGIAQRGRCREGEKTLLDAMAPAARALAAAAERGDDLPTALTGAAEAASEGAERTSSLAPEHGRAARAPERSHGHVDAGARACAIAWAAVADCDNESG
jgi:dihydroxyacetone kinase-like protein